MPIILNMGIISVVTTISNNKDHLASIGTEVDSGIT